MLKRMKKLTLLLPCLVFLAGAVSADEIHLKDGRIIHATQAWEHAKEVHFKLQKRGRLFRVNKKLVKEVKYTKGSRG